MDMTALLLLAFGALGIISSNSAVAIAALVLVLLRVTKLQQVFPWLEKNGLTIGIIVLTIGIMAPLASGKYNWHTLGGLFLHWKSLLAIAVGIGVAYLGGRGASYMSGEPTIVAGLLLGTVIGVAFFKGVPVGPLIAAGILSVLVGKT
ncbi:DUF441 domain-containing protein [Paenibacillus protaetiae]|uniref:UPF0756 membrane protein ET464_05855 n=1 Tax=Paenibacillus protaetiae TaxID=2509456 RepID=A0A4P6ESR6_9BACL|nr:DUF441 domain-containing protein [Paenibacillus protaetiae]QAY65982.1 DUF441 domain-containing protein [Paenibacillus protaetiae]